MLYIANSLSLNMLPEWRHRDAIGGSFHIVPVDNPEATLRRQEALGQEVVSAVGHADTARLFSAVCGRELPAQRMVIELTTEDILLVGQYTGPRLPEGTATLPMGARIKWWLVALDDLGEFSDNWD